MTLENILKRKDIPEEVREEVRQMISERIITGSVLKSSESKYRRLFETAKDGILILDAENGMIVDVNPFLIDLLGYSAKEFYLKEVWEIGSFKDIYANRAKFIELQKEEYVRYANLPLETKEGKKIQVEFVSNVYEVDNQKVIQCNIRDISVRITAEQKIQKLSAIVQQTADGVAVADLEGNVTFSNQSWVKMHGYSCLDEVLDKNLSIFHNKEQIEKEVNPFQKKVLELGAYAGEIGHITKEGKIFPTRMSTTLLKNEQGKPYAFAGIATDITEQKQSELALKISYSNLEKALYSTIDALASTTELRDPYTAGHQKRVSQLAVAIALEERYPLDKIKLIETAANVHDIGKINIPAEILSKPGKISKIELDLIKTHVQSSYEILKNIEFPWPLAEVVLQHHERMDGSGYPRGLKDKEIMIEAKIIAVADVIEEMSSHRPYRAALGIDSVLKEIQLKKGQLYDPKVVDSCTRLFKEKNFQFKQKEETF